MKKSKTLEEKNKIKEEVEKICKIKAKSVKIVQGVEVSESDDESDLREK